MNWIQVQTFAEGPHTYVGIEVFLPQVAESGKRYPLLMLLHDHGEDRTQWMRQARLERYAEKAGVAIALIDGNQSCFVNSVTGYAWGDYLVQELPEKLAGWFPISCEGKDRWVMGVGTGGYGALMAAQNAPDSFAGAAAVNPVLDVACLYGTDVEPKPEYLFGEKETLDVRGYALSTTFQIPVHLYCDARHEEQARQWARNGAQITVEAVGAENLLEEAFQKYVQNVKGGSRR